MRFVYINQKKKKKKKGSVGSWESSWLRANHLPTIQHMMPVSRLGDTPLTYVWKVIREWGKVQVNVS